MDIALLKNMDIKPFLFALAAFVIPGLAIAMCSTTCCRMPISHWSIEAGSGAPYNFTTSLHITQDFQPPIDIRARYKSRPFENPLYYDFRLGKWNGCMAWEFEDIHHKIYLKNVTPEAEHFSISHGYNLFYFNRAMLWHSLIWRLGAGIVIGHPESTIRRLTFNEKGGTLNNGGYYIAGASAQGSIGKRFYFKRKFFVEVEGKITASEARVVVVNGNANAPNIAIHANFGFGYDF